MTTAPVISPRARADHTGGSGRFVFVDALRGLAAVWIVLYHAFEAKHMAHLELVLPNWLGRAVHSGELAVPVFFALSGFVIAHAIGRRRVNGPYTAWFLLRRMVRLSPPYWASIAITVAVQHLWLGTHDVTPTLLSLLAHVFYLQDLLQLQPISSIYWTLCLEVQFYLVFCGLLGIVDRLQAGGTLRRSRLVVFVPVAVLSAAWPLGLIHHNLWPGLFPPTWHAFLAGALAWWVIEGTADRRWFYLYAAALVGGGICVASSFAIAAALTALLLLEVGRGGKLGDWLNCRALRFLGSISYSLYLVHNPVTAVFFSYTLYRLTPRTVAWELCWLLVGFGIMNFAAFVLWRLIEKPSVALSHYFKPPGQDA